MPGWQFMAPSRWHARDPHPHIVVYRGLGVTTPMARTARTSRDVRDVRLQRFMLKWESRPRARSAASWPMMTAAVDVGGEIHARREATRVGEATSVHPIAEGVAAAGPRDARAAIPTRLSRSSRRHASLAADRRPRGNNPARQFAVVGSRGPYPPMLVGVSGPDVHGHQIHQIDHTTILGRQRLSSSAAPMPAGILGGLWRVSLLGVGFTPAMSAIGLARPCRARSLKYCRLSSPDSCFSAIRDVPHLRESQGRCGRRS